MSLAQQLRDLLQRETRQSSRIMWTPDIRARRPADQDSYVVIGGSFDTSRALVRMQVPVAVHLDGFGGDA